MKHNHFAARMLIIMILLTVMACALVCAGHAEPAVTAELPLVETTVKGGLSEVEAAEGYISNAFGMTKGGLRKGSYLGDRLPSSRERWLYNELKTEIAAVAAGEQASTRFTYALADVFDNDGYTAADLGVDSLLVNGSIAADARDAFGEKIYAPIDRVMNALTHDCAYELYWFDKTYEHSWIDGGISMSYSYSNGEEKLYLGNYENGEVTFCFPVAAAYSVTEPKSTGTYEFDTALGQAVQTAVETAQNVVSDNEGLGDYAKLTAYKDWICSHVSYNNAALAAGTLYGDPWQMVFVFDGDDDTNVVCEGYSKAFQYLCDQSTFTGGVRAICVSGTMGGGTGAGAHMWNIVKMDDRKYYMADITNSDAGSAGSDGQLFLKGYTTYQDGVYTFVIDEQNNINVTYIYDDEDTIPLYGGSDWLNIEGANYDPGWGTDLAVPENPGWVAGSAATATWDAVEGANYYEAEVSVYSGERLLGTANTGTSSTTVDVQAQINAVIGEGSYNIVKVEFSVAAVNNANPQNVLKSDYSEPSFRLVYVLHDLPTPTGLHLVSSEGQETLSWNEVDGAECFDIQALVTKDGKEVMSGNGNLGFITDFTTEKGISSANMLEKNYQLYIFLCSQGYIETGDEVGISYALIARADVTDGTNFSTLMTEQSAYSESILYSRDDVTVLTTPENLAIENIDGVLTLSWDEVDGAEYFELMALVTENGEEIMSGTGNMGFITEFTTENGRSSADVTQKNDILYAFLCSQGYIQVGDEVEISFALVARKEMGEEPNTFTLMTEMSDYSGSFAYSSDTVNVLTVPTGLLLDDDQVLSWDEVDGAEYFDLQAYVEKDGVEVLTGNGNMGFIMEFTTSEGRSSANVREKTATLYTFLCSQGYIQDGDVVEISFALIARKDIGEGDQVRTIMTDVSDYSNAIQYDGVVEVESIDLSPASPLLYNGNSMYLGITITPQDAFYQTVEWTSSDSTVATVEGNGLIRGVAPGTADITATIGEASQTVTLTVYTIESNIENAEDEQEVTNTAGGIIDDIGNNENPDLSATDIDAANAADIQQQIHAGIGRGDEFRTDLWREALSADECAPYIPDGFRLACGFDAGFEIYHVERTGDKQKHSIGNITRFAHEVEISFNLPAGLPALQNGYRRTFTLTRIHGNDIEEIPVVINGDGTWSVRSSLFSDFVLTYKDSEYTLEEFSRPYNVYIQGHYEPEEDIAISIPWVTGAERQTLMIADASGNPPTVWVNQTWNEEPDTGFCEYSIDAGSLVDGEYIATIILEGTGYETACFDYPFEIVDSTLPVLLLTLDPETLPIGQEELRIDTAGRVEDCYMTLYLYKDGQRVDDAYYVVDDGSGSIYVQPSSFETPGTYEIKVKQYVWRRWGRMESPEAVAELTVTGTRPDAPTVTIPSGTVYDGDTVWIRVNAPGAEAVCYETTYHDSGEFLTQNGSGLIPFVAYGRSTLHFRAKVNGVWSQKTRDYTITAQTRPERPGPGMNVPSTSPQGKDITITNITRVQSAGLYTFSVGLYDEEASDNEYGIIFTDQIIYNQPFDPSDGPLVIDGCNFMDPGKYAITISAYTDGAGDWLCETTKIVNVTANTNMPAAPTVTLLTNENLLYGKTRFRVETTGGADRVYAFVKRSYDSGLDVNPVFMATNPEDLIYEYEWTNRSCNDEEDEDDYFEARFAVYRNGVWSETSDAVRFKVACPEENRRLSNVQIIRCPSEAIVGEDITVTWLEVEHAEWYEFRLNKGRVPIVSVMIPADEEERYTVMFDTSELAGVGEYWVRVTAYAAGYDAGSSNDEYFEISDPNRIITTSLQSISDGVATIRLNGVTSDKLKLKVNDDYLGEIGVGPGKTYDTIRIYVGNKVCKVEVANYGVDPSEWGVWSDPLYILDTDKILRLPENLTKIEAGAFEGIDAEEVIIPRGCSTVCEGAFVNCPNLKLVYCPYGTPDNAFVNCDPDLVIVRR